MYSSNYDSLMRSSASSLNNIIWWVIVSAVLAVIVGVILYFTFLSKKNEGRFHGFLGWMYDFLTFKKLLAENLLRILYLIAALALTLESFAFIGNFLMFLLVLILGNVILRIGYEFLLVKLLICRNTTEINSKLSNKND